MNRRTFLTQTASALAFAVTRTMTAAVPLGAASVSLAAPSAPPDYRRLLILVELKGGNDGLNTVVPYADANYYALRPRLAIARDNVVQLSDAVGLHPALQSLRPMWKASELAVLQGVGYPAPNLSHFRSIEIWDTASRSDQYLDRGWLTRTFAIAPAPSSFAADGAIVGSNDLGPLAGSGARAIAVASTNRFIQRARLARNEAAQGNAALEHILRTEAEIVQAATHLGTPHAFATPFPASPFGNAVRTACEVIANPAGIACVRLTLNGFDTHVNQLPIQARLLGDLADGLVALKDALVELDRWNDTLVVTYAEFGRRPRENQSAGTDHGTANAHFALGGRVAGGLYGAMPNLAQLGSDGNPAHAIDFRSVYATVLDHWWGISSRSVLGSGYSTIPLLRA